MVKKVKKGKLINNPLLPVVAILVLLLIGLTFYMANSKSTYDSRSSAAPKGKSYPNATLTLNQTNPKVGDVVTFTYTGIAENCGKNYGPMCLRIEVLCSQNGAEVYKGDAEARQQFLLGLGSTWSTAGGSADCTASLYYYSSYNPPTRVTVTSTSFTTGL